MTVIIIQNLTQNNTHVEPKYRYLIQFNLICNVIACLYSLLKKTQNKTINEAEKGKDGLNYIKAIFIKKNK